MIVAGPDGLSFRTSQLATDIPAEATWPSPIAVNGPTLRRLAPKLAGPDISLEYREGTLIFNTTTIPAREI